MATLTDVGRPVHVAGAMRAAAGRGVLRPARPAVVPRVAAGSLRGVGYRGGHCGAVAARSGALLLTTRRPADGSPLRRVASLWSRPAHTAGGGAVRASDGVRIAWPAVGLGQSWLVVGGSPPLFGAAALDVGIGNTIWRGQWAPAVQGGFVGLAILADVGRRINIRAGLAKIACNDPSAMVGPGPVIGETVHPLPAAWVAYPLPAGSYIGEALAALAILRGAAVVVLNGVVQVAGQTVVKGSGSALHAVSLDDALIYLGHGVGDLLAIAGGLAAPLSGARTAWRDTLRQRAADAVDRRALAMRTTARDRVPAMVADCRWLELRQ